MNEQNLDDLYLTVFGVPEPPEDPLPEQEQPDPPELAGKIAFWEAEVEDARRNVRLNLQEGEVCAARIQNLRRQDAEAEVRRLRRLLNA